VSAAAASGRKTFASLSMSDQANEIAQALRDINLTLCSINYKLGILPSEIAEESGQFDRIANQLEQIAAELNPDVIGSMAAVLKAIALK
jgi:spore maturation protein SpmA